MEHNFSLKVKKYDLTKGQARIADYIIKNQKRVLHMTSMEIAKEAGVSDASVIRFARAIGYEGFLDMKEAIRKDIEEERRNLGGESLYERFGIQAEKYSPRKDDTTTEMLQIMGMNVETSLRQNSQMVYDRTSDMILKGKQKVVVGLRGGKGCAIQFGRLLEHFTSGVWTMTEESHDQICRLQKLGPEDVVIFLNFQRYYRIDEKITAILGENEVPYCLITDSMASPATKYAREVLLVETEHCGFFHSMLGTVGILEYLLICMCWKEPDTFRERIGKRDSLLEEYRLD